MPRIAGVDIPDNKPIRISLRYIYGIGPHFAESIIKELGIDGQMRTSNLSEEDTARLNTLLDSNYIIEGGLRRQLQQNIARLRDIRAYRGERHRRGLPVRGQRTQTNARTRKGKKKTVAGKKGARK